MSFKVFYKEKNETHMLNDLSNSIDQLHLQIHKSFPLIQGKKLNLTYLDSENEEITISQDLDIDSFKQEFQLQNKIPKILMSVQEEEQVQQSKQKTQKVIQSVQSSDSQSSSDELNEENIKQGTSNEKDFKFGQDDQHTQFQTGQVINPQFPGSESNEQTQNNNNQNRKCHKGFRGQKHQWGQRGQCPWGRQNLFGGFFQNQQPQQNNPLMGLIQNGFQQLIRMSENAENEEELKKETKKFQETLKEGKKQFKESFKHCQHQQQQQQQNSNQQKQCYIPFQPFLRNMQGQQQEQQFNQEQKQEDVIIRDETEELKNQNQQLIQDNEDVDLFGVVQKDQEQVRAEQLIEEFSLFEPLIKNLDQNVVIQVIREQKFQNLEQLNDWFVLTYYSNQ